MATAVQQLSPIAPTARFEAFSKYFVRYALVLVISWIGFMKFTGPEAQAIQPLLATSPFMSWLLRVFSLQGASNFIGVAEVTTALLLALRPVSAKIGLVGGFPPSGLSWPSRASGCPWRTPPLRNRPPAASPP